MGHCLHTDPTISPSPPCLPTSALPLAASQDYIGETGEIALSAVIAGVDTAVSEEGGVLAKRERTEQVRRGTQPTLLTSSQVND